VSFGAIFLLSIGLAMDATAVAAARGLAARRVRARHVLLVALLFGGFQALMPLLGWLLGSQVGPTVQHIDHWIAFLLLGGIGAKMLYEAFQQTGESVAAAEDESELFRIGVLLMLALATSIDALAVGVTLPLLGAPLLLSLVTIGVTTAVFSAGAVLVGRRFGSMLGKRLDIAGGLVLIGLGTKILIEHLRAP
jgi:putative Mn2+ efflux pump MntP